MKALILVLLFLTTQAHAGQDRGGSPVQILTGKIGSKSDDTGKLLPLYSLGHTSMQCNGTAEKSLPATDKSTVKKESFKLNCDKDGTTLRPKCKIKFADGSSLEVSESLRRTLEGTIELGLDFYFSKNRIEAIAKADKKANGWTSVPTNKKNTVNISSDMRKLTMPLLGDLSFDLRNKDGYLFVATTPASKYPLSAKSTFEYLKSGKMYYPSTVKLSRVSDGTSDVEMILNLSDCTSK